MFDRTHFTLHLFKKWILLLLILFFNNLLKAENIVISGKVQDKKNDSICIMIKPCQLSYKKIKVEANNHFTFLFKPSCSYNFISIGNYEVILQPGDSIFFTLKNDSIANISGKYSDVNNLLIELQQSFRRLNIDFKDISLTEFLNKVNKWYVSDLEKIKSKRLKDEKLKNDFLTSYLNLEFVYKHYQFLLLKEAFNDTIQYNLADTSKDFNRYLELQDFNDTILGQSSAFYLALNLNLKNRMKKEFDKHKSYLMNLIENINEMNLPKANDDIAYCLLTYFFETAYTFNDNFFQDADSIFHYFEINAYHKENADFLRKYFEKSYGYLRLHNKMIVTELFDSLGNKISFEKFKNKVIYIKLWNLGCRGCIESIPAFNELTKSFNDTNIVYMSVAIERKTDETQWKAKIQQWNDAVKKYNLKGLSMISVQGSELYKYSQGNLPRYFIIDRNNEIIDLKAPSPDSYNLKAVLWDVIYSKRN